MLLAAPPWCSVFANFAPDERMCSFLLQCWPSFQHLFCVSPRTLQIGTKLCRKFAKTSTCVQHAITGITTQTEAIIWRPSGLPGKDGFLPDGRCFVRFLSFVLLTAHAHHCSLVAGVATNAGTFATLAVSGRDFAPCIRLLLKHQSLIDAAACLVAVVSILTPPNWLTGA